MNKTDFKFSKISYRLAFKKAKNVNRHQKSAVNHLLEYLWTFRLTGYLVVFLEGWESRFSFLG